MPSTASVARVAASNTPTNPGDDGRATPNPIIPCNNSAPSAGTGRPNAWKQIANDAPFTSHSSSDHATTPTNRPGLFSTSSPATRPDRKSTRLNSSHLVISYAVFCLKKKNKDQSISSAIDKPISDTFRVVTRTTTTK